MTVGRGALAGQLVGADASLARGHLLRLLAIDVLAEAAVVADVGSGGVGVVLDGCAVNAYAVGHGNLLVSVSGLRRSG
ncbi:hypothetical protein GCM10009821_28160 [Aeromicrobium halocynthiae]|uniref:Dispersed gene family protein 1 (DGF-1) n=1 Tax=Aeromicrobium halocynthiae TaxID=560557 RepID=A0ABN2W715_9ACTN